MPKIPRCTLSRFQAAKNRTDFGASLGLIVGLEANVLPHMFVSGLCDAQFRPIPKTHGSVALARPALELSFRDVPTELNAETRHF